MSQDSDTLATRNAKPGSNSSGRRLLVIGVVALFASVFVQRYIEKRRVEADLVWTDSGSKQTLEAGFLALGGFRGILADVLWVRAISQQDAGRYYELKLICDMIQDLQPTFTNIHSFQAHNMSYNLAAKAEACEDKWYWIRSGIEVLERGLERNKRNYALWNELGFTYMDRLGDTKMIDIISGQDCTGTMLNDLPAIDDLTEAQREKVFSHPELWMNGNVRRARRDESWRYAAYYFYKSLETKNNPSPLIVERIYGDCLVSLGHYRSKNVPIEQRKWDDWGAEEWWLELLKRNVERGNIIDRTVAANLHKTLILEIGISNAKLQAARAANRTDVIPELEKDLNDTYARLKTYVPKDTSSLTDVITQYTEAMKKRRR